MDRTQASEAWDRGSIPFGGTNDLYPKKWIQKRLLGGA